MPASQLAWVLQPRTKWARAAQPKNGAKNPISPPTNTSRSFIRIAAGSSSAPARKVSSTAPIEAMNRSQSRFAPRALRSRYCSAAKAANMPTQISTNAMEMRRWLAMIAEATANESQTAAMV